MKKYVVYTNVWQFFSRTNHTITTHLNFVLCVVLHYLYLEAIWHFIHYNENHKNVKSVFDFHYILLCMHNNQNGISYKNCSVLFTPEVISKPQTFQVF